MFLKRCLLMTVLVFTLCLLGTERQARADSLTLENASPQDLADGMANKLARGVANVATGWLEFPKQIYTTSKEEGLAKGLVVGPIKGVGMTLMRTVAGAGEAITFFIAFPGFYDPLFDPPYVWQME